LPRILTPARLIAPVPLRRFLAECWGETPLHVRGAPDRFASLFGWPALNHLLATHRLEPPRLRLVFAGERSASLDSFLRYRTTREGQRVPRLDVRELNRQLARGATLVLTSVQDMHPPLGALAREFARLFVVEPNVNLYASFGRQPGYGPHWDDHDVFVLQIAGRKRWLMYGANRRYPLYRDARPNEMQPVRPVARHVLKAGGLIYIPRGHWHDAIAVGEPTLHLTLGLPTLTGIDFLTWLTDDARGVESMRRNIPLFDTRQRAQWLRQLQHAVSRRTEATAFMRFVAGRRARFDASSRPSLPHAIHATSPPSKSDRLQWTGIAHAMTLTREGLVVQTADREYVFDIAAAPLVERLLTGKASTYGKVQQTFTRKLGAVRLRRFVSELLREHFVTIVPPR
jgi:ribosomal protein L16 Arg81 hydroxylase